MTRQFYVFDKNKIKFYNLRFYFCDGEKIRFLCSSRFSCMYRYPSMVKPLGALNSSSADLILFISFSTSARVLSKLLRAYQHTHTHIRNNIESKLVERFIRARGNGCTRCRAIKVIRIQNRPQYPFSQRHLVVRY